MDPIEITAEFRPTVLVAEDNPIHLALIKNILAKRNFNILEAENGKDAFNLFTENKNLRLVITDLNMPVLDGFELIKKIRQAEIYYTYIIVLSSIEDNRTVIKALRKGADDYIRKPVHPEELNMRLLSGMRVLKLENLEELVYSLATLAESRSKETGAHLKRVKSYITVLLDELSKGPEEKNLARPLIKTIADASILHDIGKVSIPDAILNKPARLDPEEAEIMKTHTTIGYKTLSEIFTRTNSVYIKIAAEIARNHHEQWSGQGFPDGLKGKQIPLSCRVMALADVFDALISKRVYKAAVSFEETCREIEAKSESHFDPEIVAAFKNTKQQFKRIPEIYLD